MKILYKKPKLSVVITEIEDISVDQIITLIFKLDFLPCEEFIFITLDFLVPPQDSQGREIGIWDTDYEIISLYNSKIISEYSNKSYLSKLHFYFYNSGYFEIKIKVKNAYSNGSKYLGFSVLPNRLFYTVPRTYFVSLPSSNSKILGEIFTLPEFIYGAGSPYNPSNSSAPTVQFERTELFSMEGTESEEIVILRSGTDLNFSSIVRLDIEASNADPEKDFFAPGLALYSYVQFNYGETEKRLKVSTLIDGITETPESFTMKLTTEKNARIGWQSRLTYTIGDFGG